MFGLSIDDVKKIGNKLFRLIGKHYKLLIFIPVALLAVILGYIGFENVPGPNGYVRSPYDRFYLVMQLFTFRSGDVPNPNLALQIARFAAPIVTMAAFLGFITNFFKSQIQWLKLFLMRDQVIVCGMGYVGPVIVRNLFESRPKGDVIVIEKDANNKFLDECRDRGAIVLIDDATKAETLLKARVRKADSIYIVTGDDGLNADIIEVCKKLIDDSRASANREKLQCKVHIFDSKLCTLLRNGNMLKGDRPVEISPVEISPFNIYQIAGKKVLQDSAPFDTGCLQPPRAHILIVGVGRMGESLVYHIVKKWRQRYGHLADARGTGSPLTISLLDRDASEKVRIMQAKFPSMFDYCRFVPLNMEIVSPEFSEAGYLHDYRHLLVSSVYICMDNQSDSLTTALQLNQMLLDKCPEYAGHTFCNVPIIVRTQSEGLFTFLEDISNVYRNVKPFPIVDSTCTIDTFKPDPIEAIAMAIHEYWRVNPEAGDAKEPPGRIPEWKQLTPGEKSPIRSLAVDIKGMLKNCGCDVALYNEWDENLLRFTVSETRKLEGMLQGSDSRIAGIPLHYLPEMLANVDLKIIRTKEPQSVEIPAEMPPLQA